MIYYSNSALYLPHMTFIGRWSPFHKGHVAIVQKKRREHPTLPVLILIRDTGRGAYSPSVRAEYIKRWMVAENIRGTIMVIPNIEGIYWGRKVGYTVEQVIVDKELETISGTEIRRLVHKTTNSWKHSVAQASSAYMLSKKTSDIIERGRVVWLTGCPSSGKTTIANAFVQRVKVLYPHLKTQILDGDIMRLSPLAVHVGFSRKDRADHIRRMAYLAKMFADHGILMICSFVSPDRSVREEAKNAVGEDRFLEVYVKASQKTRIQRDTKNLYHKAILGKLSNLTGYNAPYQKPLHPALTLDTDVLSSDACVHKLLGVVFN